MPKAMMVKFDCWISVYKDSSEFGLITFCSSIAPHAWCTRSEVTNKFADSKPLLNLSSRKEFNACAVQISKIYNIEIKNSIFHGKEKKIKQNSVKNMLDYTSRFHMFKFSPVFQITQKIICNYC